MAKRVLDVGVALLLLVIGLPLLVLIAVAIKLDDRSAPVLFTQRRSGRGGRPFRLIKFRTMVPGAHAMQDALRAQSRLAWPVFRLENDPRVTRVGRFLRKSSLDELPQLLNVLAGHMSLVGPRPTVVDAREYRLWQTERLNARPGLTGPWQVWGRETMEFDERCRLEISFFRRPSLVRELGLLLRTVPVVIRGTGSA